MLGGSGMGGERRDPDTLSEGDALDFWRVEETVNGKRLRLKAMMKVPGEAYLRSYQRPLCCRSRRRRR